MRANKYRHYSHFYAVIDQQWKIAHTDWPVWAGNTATAVSALLNAAEACGWELCATEAENGAMGKLVFRRPVVN